MIRDSGIIHDEPELHKRIEITNLLNLIENFPNESIFEGFNDTFGETNEAEAQNPWHFSYEVVCVTKDASGFVLEERDVLKPFDEKHSSSPNIRTLKNVYVLGMRAGDVRVASNSLSQQYSE